MNVYTHQAKETRDVAIDVIEACADVAAGGKARESDGKMQVKSRTDQVTLRGECYEAGGANMNEMLESTAVIAGLHTYVVESRKTNVGENEVTGTSRVSIKTKEIIQERI